MAKTSTFRYFSIHEPSGGLQVLFDDLIEFLRFAELQHGKNIMVYTNKAGRHFMLIHEGVCYSVAAGDYKTLEDYTDARQAGYPDAPSYYEGAAWACTTYADYQLLKATGVNDPEIIRQMNEKGYVQGFEQFKELPGGPTAIQTPHELFLAGEKGDYADFEAFFIGYKQGFDDAHEYDAAKSKGYENYTDYTAGHDGGFLHADEYHAAKKASLSDRQGYQQYQSLLHDEAAPSHDEQLLRSLLATFEPGKRLSINKIIGFLAKKKEAYLPTNEVMLPGWFRESLTSKEAIEQYFADNRDIAAFGSYDPDGEFFEVNQLNERQVVIDGANVAHGSDNHANRRPTLQNLLLITQRLRELGFEQMVIIVDASLKHRMTDGKDKKKMGELKKLADYREAPANIPADVFLIDYVRNHQCKVVTNDLFREWKLKDAWVSLNIDHYRLSFMIDGKAAMIHGLD
ncbi:NYN domain-containing protein [Parapedobacter sp. 10938]|uniref:NYN domain-containing protein n=1 Tax=Parapedobacter flavus TaxID=3110225 RepID=UPI002DBD9FE1|nr:hypothetical protein [Parapedobacter sp. 10938]MEC3880044.1 hypothetical protein [Parapedobacter sp. 10938]